MRLSNQCVYVMFLLWCVVSTGAAQSYYVDAVAGDDSASGLSESTPWKSLERVNARTYLPGERILLKRGSVWNSTRLFAPGSGLPGKPIVVSSYGTGAPPVINGAGKYSAAVLLQNQEQWEIENLEVTNLHPTNSTATRYGIYVVAANIGAVEHIVLRNLSIHDVNGDPAVKTCGGIFFEVTGGTTPTWFDSLLVEGCTVSEVSPVGIANTSTWATRTLTTNTSWYPNVNVIVRKNTIRRTVRNGMVIRVSRVPLIEQNVFDECAKDSSGNALFVFNCDSALIQYNEAFRTRYNPGDEDAGGIDADYRCKSTIIQYNYCHDNEYGGIVVVSDGSGSTTFNDGTIIRYNVLKNNGHHAIRTSGNVTNTSVYNNTIFSGSSVAAVTVVWHKSWGGYADNTRYYNNIFETQRSGSSFQLGGSTNNVFDYNVFHGIRAAGEPADAHKITADPLFMAADSVGSGWSSAKGFRLQGTSPLINAGLALTGHSSTDYAGDPVPAGTQVDRGAFEYQGPPLGVNSPGEDIRSFGLDEAYPNPFNPTTNIRFRLSSPQVVDLSVYDSIGQKVRTLHRGMEAAGSHRTSWDGTDDTGKLTSSGIYFARLTSITGTSTIKMALLR